MALLPGRTIREVVVAAGPSPQLQQLRAWPKLLELTKSFKNTLYSSFWTATEITTAALVDGCTKALPTSLSSEFFARTTTTNTAKEKKRATEVKMEQIR